MISKGGITTGTLLAEGLGLEAVQLEGQLLPGLSLVRPLAPTGLPWDGLPIVTFPGNLGDAAHLGGGLAVDGDGLSRSDSVV